MRKNKTMKEIEIFHPVSFSEKDGDKKKSEVQKTIEEWGDDRR